MIKGIEQGQKIEYLIDKACENHLYCNMVMKTGDNKEFIFKMAYNIISVYVTCL